MFDFLSPKNLVILDDYFPSLLTGFRVAEFNYYLEHFKHSEVRSSANDFTGLHKSYGDVYPQFASRVKAYEPEAAYKASLFYTVFLNNAHLFLPLIEKTKTPFVFTLYPGGGFELNHTEGTDIYLREVLGSPYLKKVIVTQEATRQYLLENHLCREEQIAYIYGVVTATEYFLDNAPTKQYYKKDKPTFDLCFVAHKYMPKGPDKGYDRFIAVAKKLAKVSDDFRFHVVGGFDEKDIEVGELKDAITFYGSRDKAFFPEFYAKMDIMLAPVTPFIATPGSFDGFPTTTCTDAALCGAATFTSDPLHQNTAFKDGEDIVLLPLDNQKISEKVLYYFDHLDELYELSAKGQAACAKIYSAENQLQPRLEVLRAALD